MDNRENKTFSDLCLKSLGQEALKFFFKMYNKAADLKLLLCYSLVAVFSRFDGFYISLLSLSWL